MIRQTVLLFIECAAVFIFLLLPPVFSTTQFTLPPQPVGWYAQAVFCFKTICAAFYEEILYRLYTPYRLNRIYTDYIRPRLYKASLASLFLFTEFPSLLLFALAHRYLGLYSVLFAAAAGGFFRIAYSKLKQFFNPAASIIIVAAVHGFWNIGVYVYLYMVEIP